MGSLGPRCPFPFRARRPERSVLWRTHGSGQNLTRLVRDILAKHSPNLHSPFLARHRENFPTAHSDQLAPFLLNITGRSIALGLSKVILRKLFVAVCLCSHHNLFFPLVIIDRSQLSTLALRLVPQEPSRWPNWIISTATELSGAGGSTEHVLDFLEIAVEEVNGADLLPTKKCGCPSRSQETMSFSTLAHRSQMFQSLREAVPIVTQAIASSIVPSTDLARLRQLHSALKCLEAWIPNLPSKYAPALLHSVTATSTCL